jgi:hypothetical protein
VSDDDVIAYLIRDTDVAPATHDADRLVRTRELLGQPALWAEPSPDLQQRVMAAVAAAEPSPTMGQQDAAAVIPGQRRRAGWIRRPVLALVAAALIVAGIGVGVAIVPARHSSRSTEYAASLTGTSRAPAANGSVTLTRTDSGWRIHLTATGLPRLDNGNYYQGWLKDRAGTLVPIGTFNQADDVTLWAGVPPTDYPTITVTRQRASNGPASSGQQVLTGSSRRIH